MWKDLVRIALMGTNRSSLPPELVQQLQSYGLSENSTPAQAMLEAAAKVGMMRKAGFKPSTWQGKLPEGSNQEIGRACSSNSSRYLQAILSGQYGDALEEFLEHAMDNRKILPPETLPDILDKCRTNPSLLYTLLPVIGERGYWLANLNEDWNYLIPPASTDNWGQVSLEEQKRILRHLRQEKPDAAIELLQDDWENLSTKEKKVFLEILSTNISTSDEAFLETCLDDRRKEVRKAASDLLLQTPDSAFIQRMFERIIPCFFMKENPGGKLKAQIDFPEALDAAAQRDGVQIANKKTTLGNFQAGQFFYMLSLVPPSMLEKHFELDSKTLLSIFVRNEWSTMLIQAMIQSTYLHQDTNWMTVLLDFWIDNHHKSRWVKTDIKPIIKVLPEYIFNKAAFNLLQKNEPGFLVDNEFAQALFFNSTCRWNDRLTLHFTKHFIDWLQSSYANYWSDKHYKNALKIMAYRCNPSLYSRLNNAFPEDERFWVSWKTEVRETLKTIAFRKVMREELVK